MFSALVTSRCGRWRADRPTRHTAREGVEHHTAFATQAQPSPGPCVADSRATPCQRANRSWSLVKAGPPSRLASTRVASVPSSQACSAAVPAGPPPSTRSLITVSVSRLTPCGHHPKRVNIPSYEKVQPPRALIAPLSESASKCAPLIHYRTCAAELPDLTRSWRSLTTYCSLPCSTPIRSSRRRTARRAARGGARTLQS